MCFKKTALVLWENGCDEESSRDTVGEAIAVIETRCDGMEMKKMDEFQFCITREQMGLTDGLEVGREEKRKIWDGGTLHWED